MNQPLATIVIPAFNAERFLARTLRSALDQTYRNLEVIVVNDGSTDDTKLLAETIAREDPRVRIISVANGGVARARNHGIEASTGEFIAFLDADDLWHPVKVESQIAALTQGEERDAAAAYTLMRIIDANDRVIRNGSGIGYSGYIFARHLFARPVGNGSSLLLRRETALSLGGFDVTWADRGIGGCEDFDLELRIATKYRIVAIRRYLVGYRVYAGNMSSNGLALARAVMATVDHHIQMHPELPEWAIRKARASALEFALQNLAGAQEWSLFLSELGRLQRVDPGRGLQYAARFAVRKLLHLTSADRDGAVGFKDRPLFYDINPDLDAENFDRAARMRDRRIVGQLESIDFACGRKKGLVR